jgi:acyl dehydratase
MREAYFEDFRVGDEMSPLVKESVSEVQLVRYAGASGDFNPLHTVARVGEAAGFGGVIAFGMLIMGMMGQALCTWIPPRYLRRFQVRFLDVTRPGDVLTVVGKVVEKRQGDGNNVVVWEVAAKDQDARVKVAGTFTAALPCRG